MAIIYKLMLSKYNSQHSLILSLPLKAFPISKKSNDNKKKFIYLDPPVGNCYCLILIVNYETKYDMCC